MIYLNTLFDSFQNPGGYNVGGCKRIFLTESSEVGQYTIADRQITDLPSNEPWAVMEDLDGLTFSVKPKPTKGGSLCIIDIAFTVSALRADANYMLESLCNSEYTAIVEDLNGRFWLLGYRDGLRTNYEMLSEDGGYTVKMNTEQRFKSEEVAGSVVAGLDYYDFYNNNTPNPIFTPQVGPSTGGGSGGSTQTGNVFSTITVTSLPYSVKNNDHYIIVKETGDVYLPSNPQPGQQHIIKAQYDAYEASVWIYPAEGHTIDDYSYHSITTAYGALGFIFKNGNWSTVAIAI